MSEFKPYCADVDVIIRSHRPAGKHMRKIKFYKSRRKKQ